MMELLHATDTRLGLVTNGNDWMLVDAPKGETTGFITWDATFWAEEPLTLRAFRSLLGVHRFFSVADDETLEAMLKESASNQQEVTDRLGYQVREAVEVIIRSLDRIDRDEKGQLLAGVSEPDLYEAALTVMMRLVFLFSAEERGLLLLGDPLYDEHYAVSTLVARLQEAADQHGEEVLERRHDAWVRLLSTFRAVYGGVRHDRLKLLPYAGRLFDPDRFPFLEGRRPGTTWKDAPATPLPIDNRTVLHLLRSLQYLEMQGEARRLSFRALDIEQIGHVYEGLLDHTARRATEPMLSLTAARGDEPEVALSELERLRAKGEADLLKFLAGKDVTGRSESALKKALDSPVEGDAAKKLRAACGDERLFNRVRPFSGLVRNDTFDRPVVIRPGSVFVTAGTDRRSSGTHYTPRSLTEPIVQYTLEPLVYVGPAEGKPKEEWTLRPAGELLDLKVCDMACGSGAFLVQACRYLSERLVEAWEDAEKRHPGVPGITPEGTASTGAAQEQLIPKDTERAAGLRPSPRRPAVPVRRGQEPARRRDGQALDLAADPGQGQAVHVPRSRDPVRRFAGRDQQRDAVEDLLARRPGDRDHAAELPRHDPQDHAGDPAAAGPTGEDRRRHGEQRRGESSGSSPTSGSRPSGSTTPPTACWPQAGNPPSRPSESSS